MIDLYKKQKKIINIAYFWHVELSPDHNLLNTTRILQYICKIW